MTTTQAPPQMKSKRDEKGRITMTRSKAARMITGSVLVLGSMCSLASAQNVAPEGRIYVFHSKPTGTCPALDWHVVVGASNALGGMIAWDNMKAMANVTGSFKPDGTYAMTAKEEGGRQRTATVTGKLKGDGWLTANIKGPNIDCPNIDIPWFVPPPQGGG